MGSLFGRLISTFILFAPSTYLATDRKSAMNKSLHNYLWRNGHLAEGEYLDPSALKCKLIFVCIQLAFTVVTITYIPILFYSYAASCVYLGNMTIGIAYPYELC